MIPDPNDIKKSVLIVDDDPSVRLMLGEALESAGFMVEEAEDGEQAVAFLENCIPDLIMLDVVMPGMDGFEVCTLLRQDSEKAEIPIVMVTGNDDVASIRRAYDLGVTDFITKPIPWGTIGYRVSFLLRATRAFSHLKREESRLAHAQRIAKIGSWEWVPESDKIWFSKEALRIFHLDPEAYEASYQSFISSIHPVDRTKVDDAIAEAMEHSGSYSLDHQLALSDGSLCYAHTEAEVIRDRNGVPIRLEGTVQDITERKQAETKLREYAHTQAMLLSEVNHRVKNNLAAIISLLNKEADRAVAEGMPDCVPLLNNLVTRIEGLLTVHSMLSSTNWQPLNLGELCRQLLEPFDLGTRLSIPDTTILVDSGQAHYLTLVVNELATNSMKYAMADRSRLAISLAFSEQDGRIRIQYRDNGCGYPELKDGGDPTGGGIGSDLIFGIVRTSLRGSVTLHNDNGAVAMIDFPAGINCREGDAG